MKRKKKRGPLLYITKPFSGVPKNNMQEVYTNRYVQQEMPLEVPREESVKKKNIFKVSLAKSDDLLEKDIIEELPEQASQTKEEENRSFKRVKSFKEMDIGERLEYLRNFPKAFPPVPCVFRTDEKPYQGYLVDYNEQEVTIKLPNQSTEIIARNAITEVAMIGIKR
ncbi:CotO family spore coat protein [Bacillus sp. MRMR6]|uniref:CotO family spore coat protein n=1 Tax=Bacillus sp. MRMR6 TaxID=1928617 RepID=UPI000951D77F|nr:CotO family spore coat protein [Bacillus sp. MRMR6]OLS41832.1 hypothetical protein BTR25_00205 [Bacillus sp. MRMR6]